MNIKIVSARYGVPGALADVTATVQTIAEQANGTVPINNQAMGGDPAVGHLKQLSVVYFYDMRAPQTMVGTEGSTITLAAKSAGLGMLPPDHL